jgi:hypothetical protein
MFLQVTALAWAQLKPMPSTAQVMTILFVVGSAKSSYILLSCCSGLGIADKLRL